MYTWKETVALQEDENKYRGRQQVLKLPQKLYLQGKKEALTNVHTLFISTPPEHALLQNILLASFCFSEGKGSGSHVWFHVHIHSFAIDAT